MNQHVPLAANRSAVFLMRDGVMCEGAAVGAESLPVWDECAVLSGTLEGLRTLAALDADIIALAPTQEGDSLDHRHMPAAQDDTLRASLRGLGARIGAVVTYSARTEHAQHDLARLLRRVARQRGVDLATSLLVTDTWADAAAAQAAGCQPVLVMTGRGRDQLTRPQAPSLRARTWYAADLATAALSVEAQLQAQLQARPTEVSAPTGDAAAPDLAAPADTPSTQTVA